ncbi:MAG: hypothetical protein H7A21_10710 [Spirochaetales bacterium]|nr:hypothetical protein [Leptospiraceae bacterium]MCP5481894.1 hypothetical protein [Spirochaetales bacterium]MCP5486300.1 hypothetical protein [Spirochaetales bacterium]
MGVRELRWLSPLPVILALAHMAFYAQRGEMLGALWLCNLIAIGLGIGLLLRLRVLVAVSALMELPAALIWLVNIVRADEIFPTSIALHLGNLYIACLALRAYSVQVTDIAIGLVVVALAQALTWALSSTVAAPLQGAVLSVNAVLMADRTWGRIVRYYGVVYLICGSLGTLSWLLARRVIHRGGPAHG